MPAARRNRRFLIRVQANPTEQGSRGRDAHGFLFPSISKYFIRLSSEEEDSRAVLLYSRAHESMQTNLLVFVRN